MEKKLLTHFLVMTRITKIAICKNDLRLISKQVESTVSTAKWKTNLKKNCQLFLLIEAILGIKFTPTP